MIINPENLADCSKGILELADRLEYIAGLHKTTLVVHRTKSKNPTGNSWHDDGRAIDFSFANINVFKLCTELYYFCAGQEGAFKGVTEFEMVRGFINGLPAQHFHIAKGDESRLETFTSDYSHYK